MTHTFDSEVSLHYWMVWPTVRRIASRPSCLTHCLRLSGPFISMTIHPISVLTSFFLVPELVIFILFHFKHGWEGLKAESHLWNVKKKRKKNQDKDNSLKNTFVWDVFVGMLIRFYFVSISTNSWSLFCQGFTFTLIRNQKGMPVSLHYLLTRKIGPPYHHQCRGGFLIGCLLITGA